MRHRRGTFIAGAVGIAMVLAIVAAIQLLGRASGPPGADATTDAGGQAPRDDQAFFEPFVVRYREIMTRGQPQEGDNFITLLDAADAELQALSERFGAPITRTDGSVVFLIDFDVLSATGEWRGERGRDEERRAVREALSALSQAQAWERWSRMVAAPRYERTVDVGPLVSMELPQLPKVRRVARVLRAAARESASSGDFATAAARVEDTLALSRQAAREPALLGRLVAHAVEAVAFGEARHIARAPATDGKTLETLAQSLREHRIPSIETAADAELLLFESSAADVYANGPAGIQRLAGGGGGPGTPLPEGGLGEGLPGREADMAEATALYTSLKEVVALPRAARLAQAPEAFRRASQSRSLLVGLLWPPIERFLLLNDQAAAEHIGTKVIVALERYKREHGEYPESLDVLAPAFLAETPRDPYVGTTLGYLPPSAGPYEGGRAYVLYAAGPDGKDDRGNVNFQERFRLVEDGSPIPGLDLLLND